MTRCSLERRRWRNETAEFEKLQAHQREREDDCKRMDQTLIVDRKLVMSQRKLDERVTHTPKGHCEGQSKIYKLTACDCEHLEVLPLTDNECSKQPATPGRNPFWRRRSKKELRIMCSLMALPTRAKKIFPSQLVSAIGRKFDGSVAGPDL